MSVDVLSLTSRSAVLVGYGEAADGSGIVWPGKEQMLSVLWCTRAAAWAFLMGERLQRYVCHQIVEK